MLHAFRTRNVFLLCLLLMCCLGACAQADWNWQYVDDFWTQKAKDASYSHSAFLSKPGYSLNGYLCYIANPLGGGYQLAFYPGWEFEALAAYMDFQVPFADVPGPITSGSLQIDVRPLESQFGLLVVLPVGGFGEFIQEPGIYNIPLTSGVFRLEGYGFALDSMTITLQGAGEPMPIKQVKQQPDGSPVSLLSAGMSRWFWDGAYIQEPDRSVGVKVNNVPYASAGELMDIVGIVGSNDNERFVDATRCVPLGVYSDVKPLGMANRCVGSSRGPNNQDLLVKVWGKFTFEDYSTFYVDDGSGPIKCVMMPGMSFDPSLTWASVTGISCTEIVDGQPRPYIKIALSQDVIPLE